MGFWGAVVGGILGGAVGGPWGAGLGAAVGSAFGGGEDATTPGGSEQLPMEVRFEDDEDGRVLILLPQFPAHQVAAYRVDFVDPSTDTLVRGRAPYRDDDGDFYIVAAPADAQGNAHCYVPLGAAKLPKGPVITRVLTLGEGEVLGASLFELSWPRGTFSRARFLRPLVALAMRVARADGQLDRSEVAHIREALGSAFELTGSAQGDLRDLMKSPTSADIATLVGQIWQRMPDIEEHAVVGLLASVAHADGVVHPAEVEVIREVALALGLDPEDWPDVAADLGLVSSDARQADLLAVFGLAPGASLRDLKTAYRAKMRDYHPDKVAHLPAEFQEVAHRKSQELNEAFDALKAMLPA